MFMISQGRRQQQDHLEALQTAFKHSQAEIVDLMESSIRAQTLLTENQALQRYPTCCAPLCYGSLGLKRLAVHLQTL